MSNTVSKRHLYLYRRQGQALTFTVGDTEFEIKIGEINKIHNNVTVDIVAPSSVRVTRSELRGL